MSNKALIPPSIVCNQDERTSSTDTYAKTAGKQGAWNPPVLQFGLIGAHERTFSTMAPTILTNPKHQTGSVLNGEPDQDEKPGKKTLTPTTCNPYLINFKAMEYVFILSTFPGRMSWITENVLKGMHAEGL